VFKTLIWLY